MLIQKPYSFSNRENIQNSAIPENQLQHLELVTMNKENQPLFEAFLLQKAVITSALPQAESLDLSQFDFSIGVGTCEQLFCCYLASRHPLFYDFYFVHSIFEKNHSQKDFQKALSLFLDHLFIEKKANRIEIEVAHKGENGGTIGVYEILQHGDFCFEGIKRGVFRKEKEPSFQGNRSHFPTETYSFSMLAEDYFKRLVTNSTAFSSEEYEKEIGNRLCRKTEDIGVDLLVIRAVIMKERGKIAAPISTEEPISPHDLCILLIQKSDETEKVAYEELIGIEIEETKKTIRDLLDIKIEQELGTQIIAPIGFMHSFDFIREDGKKVRELVFRVEVGDDIRYVEDSKRGKTHWVPLHHLIKTPLHPEVMAILCKSQGSNIDLLPESKTKRDEGIFLEVVKSDLALSELYDALVHGLHVQAYAARGFRLQEMVGIILRNESGDLAGGLLVEFQYGGCFCHKMWIDPELDTHKVQRRIMKKAEELAAQEGAKSIFFACMDWEVNAVFQQLGYRIEWERGGYNRNSRLIYLRKELI